MDLSKFSSLELQTIERFAEALADQNQTEAIVDFDDVDLEGAQKQAELFLAEKAAGRSGKAEVAGDKKAREQVREWAIRTGRIPRESA